MRVVKGVLSRILCFCLLALSLAFGLLREAGPDADELIPVYCSLWKLEPFYWQQNRLGMLWAYLCCPIRDPLWNWYAQNLLTTIGFLSSCYLLPLCLGARELWWQWGCWAITLAAICFVPNMILRSFTVVHLPLGGALLFLCLGWLAGKRKLWLPCFLAYATCLWVNISLGPLALVLVCLQGWLEKIPFKRHAGIIAGTFVTWVWLVKHAHVDDPKQWGWVLPDLNSFRQAGEEIGSTVQLWPCLLALVLLAISLPRLRREVPRVAALVAAGVCLAFAQFLCSSWAHMGNYAYRYFLQGFWLCTLLLALPFAVWRKGSRFEEWIPVAVILPLFGLIAPRATFESWAERRAGALPQEARELRADMVGGDYWNVWLLGFITWVQEYPSKRQGLQPLSLRAETVRERWMERLKGGARVVIPTLEWWRFLDYTLFNNHMDDFPLRWVSVGRGPHFICVQAVPLGGAEPGVERVEHQELARPELVSAGIAELGLGWQAQGSELHSVGYLADLLIQPPAARNTLHVVLQSTSSQPRHLNLRWRGKALPAVEIKQNGALELRVPIEGTEPGRLGLNTDIPDHASYRGADLNLTLLRVECLPASP